MRKGVAVSPGVVVGRALLVDNALSSVEPQRLGPGQAAAELDRLHKATAATEKELAALVTKVSTQVGESEADIFRAHHLILTDPSLIKKVKAHITDAGLTAPSALHAVLNEYASLFARIKDEYLKHRMADVRDVIARIQSHLLEETTDGVGGDNEPVIVIAHEILPSQAMSLGRFNVVGIVTEAGSVTSHAAILARSRAIPAVSGVRGITQEVQTGDTVIVDGRDGHVLLNPGPEVESAFRKLQREFVHLKTKLVANRDQPAVTRDGIPIELMANINNAADATLATDVGVVGVGLFRTEYLYLTHPSVPDEAEQLAVYKQVIEATPNRRVTIRTLDLGGDKTVPYLGHRLEANPFMGWRSLRLSFEHPEFFQTQIRAILRAGRYGRVRMLFPMVTTVEELKRVQRMVKRCRQELTRRRQRFGKNLEIGVMLEVPAAAICVDTMLDLVDFVSIGSNDLVQYLNAADRDNPKVAHLCEPLSPAVLRVIKSVVDACTAAKKPLTLCGEMAGQPRAFLVLLGLGLRQFSMSPALVPTIKELIRSTRLAEAQIIARHVLTMKTSHHIRAFLGRHLHRICPKLDMLETTR